MLVTAMGIKMNYRDHGTITIPEGIRTTHQTAMGIDESYNFVADLSWIPKNQYGLKHDATYYGINIPRELLKEI